MVYLYLGTLFIVMCLTPTNSIVVKRNPSSDLKLFLPSNNLNNIPNLNKFRSDVYEVQQLNWNNFNSVASFLKGTNSKILPSKENKILTPSHQINGISKSVQYLDDVKPIYEEDTEGYSISPEDNLGYFYKPPSHSNLQILNNSNIKPKDAPLSQKLTKAIVFLDRYLKPLLNADSYNSPVHPPLNPILSLILSRYGKYVPDNSYSQIYAYAAENNIHNNKPFGQYKYGGQEV